MNKMDKMDKQKIESLIKKYNQDPSKKNETALLNELRKTAEIEKIIDDYMSNFVNLFTENPLREYEVPEPFQRIPYKVFSVLLQEHLKERRESGQLSEEVFLEIANPILYHNFRSKISTGSFEKMEGEKWPVADLSSPRLTGKAYMMPDREEPIMGDIRLSIWQELMANKVMDLTRQGDLAADVFDILTAKWLKEAKHFEAMVNITADDFLQARGLKGKDGKISGRYTEEQRKSVQKQIDILSYTWITVEEMEIIQITEKGERKKTKWRGESKAIALTSRFGQVRIDGSTDAYAWRLRPGDVFAKFLFGPGRQTALLSQKSLQYDYYREFREKRLARYFAWIWRISSQRTMEGVTVKTLLEVTGDIDTIERPGRARERLEKALDRLEDDGVITAWQYEAIKESEAGKRGWVDNWLNCKIIVEPPQEILDHYKELQKIDPAAELNAKTAMTTKDRIKNVRKEHGLTLTRAAEQIGINASTLSRIERGGNLSGKTADKVKKWLKQHEG